MLQRVMLAAGLFLCCLLVGCLGGHDAPGGGDDDDTGAGGAPTVDGGDMAVDGSARIDGVLSLGPACGFGLEPLGAALLAEGRYDLAADAETGSGYCRNDYAPPLRIREEAGMGGQTEPLLIDRVEVSLTTPEGVVLELGADDGAPLPNPFSQIVNVQLLPPDPDLPVVAALTTALIPASYAAPLRPYVGATIMAELRVFGARRRGVERSLPAFAFPIALCDGCLTGCASAFDGDPDARAAAVGDACDDDAGQDGRVCFDPGC